jgi:hypothetical protein
MKRKNRRNSIMKKYFIIIVSLYVLGTGAVGFSSDAQASPLMAKDYEGISYVSGGIGLDEREAIQTMVQDYNLKIVFSLRQGNYLADIAVQIKDAAGKIVMDAVSDGPWFYTQLPAGHYTVSATMAEKTENQKIEIKSAGHALLYFYWSE